ETLILKSTERSKTNFKLNEAESGIIDTKLSESALKNLIKSEDFIYKSLPNHQLSKEEAIEYTKYLIATRDYIDLQLVNFKVLEKEKEQINIDDLTSDILFITSKNNFKKTLKKIGVDVQRIIVADVPLVIEDMKEINPKIPENALKGINKKIEHVHNDIERKTSSLNPSKIIIIAENDINGTLLAKRAKEMYNADVYLNDNLKDLTDLDLKEIL
ncbi:DUF2100 domain-containing protein, partial [Methanobrevibacter sp. OttesenSCG-928-I08]|nr:DUF2100 domain-containing protein [Methanobrevibacter sp. OttesenSCG-928-I08]